MSDFFKALDALDGDEALAEGSEERAAYNTAFEGELIKHWSKATSSRQRDTSANILHAGGQLSGKQLDSDVRASPELRQQPRLRSRQAVSERTLSRLAPNLIPTAPASSTIDTESPISISEPSSPSQESPADRDMSKKPTLDLRSFRQNSGPTETTDQKRYREGYEKFVKQMEKAMAKEEKAIAEGIPPAKRAANKFRIASDLLNGLRFVVVWSPRGWRLVLGLLEKIHVHGGKFAMRYEDGVTHLLCSDDMSEGDFLKHSGFAKIEDIPSSVTSLHVRWLHDSLTYKGLKPVEPYLFPKPKSTSVPAKRKATDRTRPPPTKQIRYDPTDSDTPESIRPLPPGLTLAPQRSRLERREDEAESSASSPASAGNGLDEITEDIEEGDISLEGPAQPERRFYLPPGVKADALDEVISGIISGTIVDEEEQAELSGPHATGQQEARDGPYKCQQANAGRRECINEDLVVGMEELAKRYEHAPGKNDFAKMSYGRAASALRNVTHRIETKEQAQKIRGIGNNLADRIGEILTLGRSLRAQYEDTPQARTISMFGKIYGVGPSRANELWNLGVRSLDDLRQPANPFKLSEHQLFGLEYYDDLNTRMPRAEVQALYDIIAGEARKIDPKVQIDAMGSFRRGEDTSGDLDCLITRDDSDGKTHAGLMGKLVDRLSVMGIITHHLSQPSDYRSLECKWMGCGRLSPSSKLRRIDILAIPFEQHGAALLYFTGNDIFNRSIRLYARKHSYSLNQRGLYKDVVRDPKAKNTKISQGTLIASRTEQEIFDVLGIRWREPRLRRP